MLFNHLSSQLSVSTACRVASKVPHTALLLEEIHNVTLHPASQHSSWLASYWLFIGHSLCTRVNAEDISNYNRAVSIETVEFLKSSSEASLREADA